MKTIPKSLHTVTVLVAIARVSVLAGRNYSDPVEEALAVLGYAGAPDEYQLASKARAILAKSVQA